MAYMNSSHKADGTAVQVDLGRGTVLKGSVSKMPFCPNGYCPLCPTPSSSCACDVHALPDAGVQVLPCPSLRWQRQLAYLSLFPSCRVFRNEP
jgi:hypothetical protein